MADRLIRNFVLALGIFIVVTVLVYMNVEFAEPVTDYVSFVVNTNFSIQPILEKMDIQQKWATWDIGSLLRDWSEAPFGW